MNSNMSDEVLIRNVKQICKKKPNERTNAELQELQQLTRTSKVFKNLVEANGESAHLACCRYLIYEFREIDTYLFRSGDLGSRFYIIISGTVGIEIPFLDLIGEKKAIEVVQIGKGGSFGELALESSKPRAASIRCKVPSHFVALEKVDYNRMIAKFVRDKRNNTVNFLQSLPVFANTTKGSLGKLTYNFREKEYVRGQIVYKEGDEATEIFLITEGEFVLQKKIKVADGRKKYEKEEEPYSKNSEVRKHRAKGLYKQLVQRGDVAKFGTGELFGIEENGNSRKFTCICNCTKAKVLVILKSDFTRRFKGDDIFQYIDQRNLEKKKEIGERVNMWKHIAEQNAGSLSPMQLRKQGKEIVKLLESSQKPETKPKKTSSVAIFSKKIATLPNQRLHRLVDQDLQKIRSHQYSTRNQDPIQTLSHTPSLTSRRISSLKNSLKSNLRSTTPQFFTPGLTMYPMNSKHIYEILHY